MSKKLAEIEDTQYIKKQCINFIQDTITEMEDIKKLIDKSFSKKNNLFTNQTLKLPRAIIQYYNRDNKNIICYTYNVTRLADFFNASIYHILSDNKVIKQCPACKTYFIPDSKTEDYCYGKYGMNRNKCRGKHTGYFDIANKYYERLCRLLRINGDNERKERLQNEYKIVKSNVIRNGLTQMEQERELIEFLRNFELEMNNYDSTKCEYPKFEMLFNEQYNVTKA